MSNRPLLDKIVLVTGASRGIGRGIALAMGREGARVIGTATTPEGAEMITHNLHEAGLSGEGMMMDVTAPHTIETIFAVAKERYGPFNVLVNNAAITQDNLLLRMKDDEWMKVIETNLNAIYRLTKACLRDMLKARWGRVINIGSVVGAIGNPGQANYCAAKAGMVGFSKAVALEVGSRNITVNTVSPGYIETDMTNALTDGQREAIFSRIPMQRIGSIEDVAAAVVFLASPAAGYITGQTLHVNGGIYMN